MWLNYATGHVRGICGAAALLALASVGLFLSDVIIAAAACGLLAAGLSAMASLSTRARNTKDSVATQTTEQEGSPQAEGAELLSSLTQAIVENKGFTVLYQPILNAQNGAIAGAEALVRWHSDDLGMMEPDQFIPLAESSGLLRELSLLIVDQVALDLARFAAPGFRINVNLSPLQIVDPGFEADMTRALSDHNIAPDRVEIEVTENAIVPNPDMLPQALTHLKSRGYTIALDDYGSGFSSLGYLRKGAFDTLKVDRLLVIDAMKSPQSRALLEATLTMARVLNMRTVAEGVETQTQYNILAAMGFDMVQGYFCGVAVSMEELSRHWTTQNAQERTRA
ncbi:MAG: EAL domain-containing protein [Pseudomonadota bacterium]